MGHSSEVKQILCQMIRIADTTVTEHVEILLANRDATVGNGNV